MLLVEKPSEIGTAASYFICFKILHLLSPKQRKLLKKVEKEFQQAEQTKQGESRWRREWLQWLKRRSKWLKRRRRWCCWWSSKLMLQWWSLVVVSCCKYQVFSKKPSYICTGPKRKYRLKSSEICRNSRNKPEHPGILGSTIQPCFCTGSGARTKYSGGTGRYGTKSSSLVYIQPIYIYILYNN